MKNFSFQQSCVFFFKEFPRQTALTSVFLLLSSFVESIGAISIVPLIAIMISDQHTLNPFVSQIEDLFVGVGVNPTLPNVLIVITVAMLVKALLTLLAQRQVGYVEAEVSTRLRVSLLDCLLRTHWSFFVKQPSGMLTYALSTECTHAGNALRILALATSYLLQAVVYLFVGLYVSWQLLFSGLLFGLLLIFASHAMIKMVRLAGVRHAAALNAMNVLLTDSLAGAKPLKVMNVEQHFVRHIKRQANLCEEAARKRAVGMGLMLSVQEPVITVIMACGLFGAYSVLKMDAVLILPMAFFFHRILSRLSSFQHSLQNFGTLEGSLMSLIGKIEDISKHRENQSGTERVVLERAVEMRDVSVCYGEKQVLDSFSMMVRVGEITALSGPSGAGKTTVADMIAGLLSPSKGAVLVDGVDLAGADIGAWREQIGYVPQEVFLFNDTIRLNISLGRECSDEEIWTALETAGARSFVELLPGELESIVGEHGRSLSGGQKQRLMIARALVARPRLLILDESTTGLDEETERAILQSVSKMKSSIAVLAISHQKGMLDVADHVIEFKGAS